MFKVEENNKKSYVNLKQLEWVVDLEKNFENK